jgi:DNA polymerase-1
MIVTADYSQIELRMMAQLSGDRLLMSVYRRNLDAHRQTAALVNEVSLEEVTKAMRQSAKPVNFGLIFGMGAKRLVEYAMSAYGVVLSLKEAEGFRERFFDGYSGVRSWHHKTLENGKKTGISRTMSGRIRYLEETAYSEHLNTPVQGSCADGLKASLPNVYQRLKKYGGRAKLVHMVHDEIEIESGDDPEELESIKQDLVDGMTEGMQQFLSDVPVVVDAAYGKSWAEH